MFCVPGKDQFLGRLQDVRFYKDALTNRWGFNDLHCIFFVTPEVSICNYAILGLRSIFKYSVDTNNAADIWALINARGLYHSNVRDKKIIFDGDNQLWEMNTV